MIGLRFTDVVRNQMDVVHDWFDNSFNQMICEYNLMDSFTIEDTNGSI